MTGGALIDRGATQGPGRDAPCGVELSAQAGDRGVRRPGGPAGWVLLMVSRTRPAGEHGPGACDWSAETGVRGGAAVWAARPAGSWGRYPLNSFQEIVDSSGSAALRTSLMFASVARMSITNTVVPASSVPAPATSTIFVA